jgi:DNA gyrase inhibitor GyrI
MNMAKMEVRLERLETMHAAHAHAFSETPEEDAWSKLEAWAKPKGLLEEGIGTRVFGRNTYPTDNPEPHGYEFFLTVGPGIEPEGDINIREIPGGLYAVLRFKNLDNIGRAWEHLWKWTKESRYEHIGWRKGEHGWCNGFEEHLNWLEGSPNQWIFDLWVQLKE